VYSFKNAIYLMLAVVEEVSPLNEFEKILKHTKFQNNYDKKRAIKDYEHLLKLKEKIENALSPEERQKDYAWLNHISNCDLVDLFQSQEMLRNIIIFMNAGIKELVEG